MKGNKDVEDLVQKERVGLLLLLNMEVDEYVKTLYDSWDRYDVEKVCRGFLKV
ncbi:MAG: hypothetical protein U9O85_09005 [Euryarchaeota archaeon]|nr:hypothetical protein [Euryarchaeota archaeon]